MLLFSVLCLCCSLAHYESLSITWWCNRHEYARCAPISETRYWWLQISWAFPAACKLHLRSMSLNEATINTSTHYTNSFIQKASSVSPLFLLRYLMFCIMSALTALSCLTPLTLKMTLGRDGKLKRWKRWNGIKCNFYLWLIFKTNVANKVGNLQPTLCSMCNAQRAYNQFNLSQRFCWIANTVWQRNVWNSPI